MAEPTFDSREPRESIPAPGPLHELDALTDEALVRRYRSGLAADVFAEMVRRHQPMVLRTCLRLVGNIHDAEDATQSVFLVLAQRPEVVRRSLAGCLHELARAAVSELCRSRRRRSQREELAARINSLVGRLRGGHHPMDNQELREELDAALGHLPDALRQAVILRYLEGHSQQEAARRAGCTQVTMGWRAMKGLQRLRTILARRGVALSMAALLAQLEAEAQAAGAMALGSVAAATATSAQLAAALLRTTAAGNHARKLVLVGLLAFAAVGLGAGIAFLPKEVHPPTQAPTAAAVPGPTVPVPASPLGMFDRSLDIGGPAHAGAARLADGTFTIQGGGRHIYGPKDQFRFVCRSWTGDGEIVARVHSDPDQEARQVAAGVMFRERLTDDSHHVSLLLTTRDSDIKLRTSKFPASACTILPLDAPGKHWLRLVRRGNTFTAFLRADGAEAWKELKQLEVPLSPTLYVGLAVTAHDDARLATAVFDGVAVRGGDR